MAFGRQDHLEGQRLQASPASTAVASSQCNARLGRPRRRSSLSIAGQVIMHRGEKDAPLDRKRRARIACERGTSCSDALQHQEGRAACAHRFA